MRRSALSVHVVAAVVSATTILGPAVVRSQTGTPAVAAGNAQKGQQLYTSYGCYECHGRQAQGSTATGPRLAPRPLPFAAFSKYVRGPSGQMPPYTTRVVSDAELADIYAFLAARPQPPAVESIPLLK